MYNLYREPWLVAKLDGMLGDVFGTDRWFGWSDRRRRSSPPGPAVDALEGGPPPGDAWTRCPTSACRTRSRRRMTGHSCICGAARSRRTTWRPSPSSSASPWRPSSGRARHVDADPALQPALLRPRHRVPAARDEEPRVVQPAVRDDLARQRARVLRDPGQRPAGDPGEHCGFKPAEPRADVRRSLRRHRGRLPRARRRPAHRPARGCATPWRPRSPSHRSSSPTSCSPTRSGTRTRRTCRSPPTCWARWSVARWSTWPW